MLGIDGFFVKSSDAITSAPPQPPVVAGPPAKVARAEPPQPLWPNLPDPHRDDPTAPRAACQGHAYAKRTGIQNRGTTSGSSNASPSTTGHASRKAGPWTASSLPLHPAPP